MTILKANQTKGKYIILVFIILFMASALAVVVRDVFKSEFELFTMLKSFSILIVTVILAKWLYMESVRVRSVHMTEEGVFFLKWRLFPIPTLIDDHLKWGEIQDIGLRAGNIYLKGRGTRVSVNTIFFDDPSGVLSFMKSKIPLRL